GEAENAPTEEPRGSPTRTPARRAPSGPGYSPCPWQDSIRQLEFPCLLAGLDRYDERRGLWTGVFLGNLHVGAGTLLPGLDAGCFLRGKAFSVAGRALATVVLDLFRGVEELGVDGDYHFSDRHIRNAVRPVRRQGTGINALVLAVKSDASSGYG